MERIKTEKEESIVDIKFFIISLGAIILSMFAKVYVIEYIADSSNRKLCYDLVKCKTDESTNNEAMQLCRDNVCC